ncbi:serine proteinase [Trichophyton violaceum]|uniref:Serine proteinase n=1 Tax=Trichophyton violaceum TaxID=34388 RepID=A0A178FKS5_TRIVO|nr:serine proteinase [Trichophyton violaceum]
MGCIKVISVFLAAVAAVDARAFFHNRGGNDVIPNSYIVVMKDGVTAEDFDSHISSVAATHSLNKAKRGSETVGHKDSFNINGWRAYNGHFDEATIESILNDDKVNYVEHDRVVKLAALTTQPNAPTWGLGRVSHKAPGNKDFVYDSSAGQGITIYGVDTGIDIHHSEFAGRIRWGTNTVDNDNTDGNGHGTHTAGTFAGTTYGVAKKANIVAVKVLSAGGSGSTSGVIKGIDWCVTDARSKNTLGKAALNLSLGGSFSQASNDAVTRAQEAGIFVAVAAGNDNRDAKNSSPASAPAVCTAASSTIDDQKSSFSNWGTIVDIYAPGSNILSAAPGGGTRTLSGTSMASPHVCGVGAAMLAQGVSVAQACNRLKQIGNAVIRNPGTGTTNRLLYNGSGR